MIIDDHPVYRDALSEKIGQCFAPQGVPVWAVNGAQEGLDAIGDSQDQWVVVIDVLMPGLSGLAGIKAFKALPQVLHVVALSGLDEKLWEPRTVSAGATLFLSKSSTSSLICSKLAQLVELPEEPAADVPVAKTPGYRLTDRQRQVLSLIALGHPNKIIADELDISEQTVKIHVGQIFKELRVFNRTQAVLKAQKANLLNA